MSEFSSFVTKGFELKSWRRLKSQGNMTDPLRLFFRNLSCGFSPVSWFQFDNTTPARRLGTKWRRRLDDGDVDEAVGGGCVSMAGGVRHRAIPDPEVKLPTREVSAESWRLNRKSVFNGREKS